MRPGQVEAAEFLALNRIPVISGMGGGVDSAAVTACLNKNGYAVAVLPNGIDVVVHEAVA